MPKDAFLPLLVVKRKLKSLDSMTVDDYKTFIPFMIKCAEQPSNLVAPKWWLDSVEYRFPLTKPYGMDNEKFRRTLRSIVVRCYSFHNEDNTLMVSATLARNPSLVSISHSSNDDTTSVFVRGKFVMKIRNLNWNYDSMPYTLKSPLKPQRRKLLPVKTITDVFLCDNCDAEFSCQSEITAHERLCYGWVSSAAPQTSPSDLLGYLQLDAVGVLKPIENQELLKNSLTQNRSIEFSSLLGRRILKTRHKADIAANPLKSVQLYEHFCLGRQRSGKLRDSYCFRALNRKKKKPDFENCRDYCFTRRQRFERYKTLKAGLDAPSRQLLKTVKKCSVRLTRYVPPAPLVITLSSDEE